MVHTSRIVEAREMGEEDSPVVTPSFFDTFFEGLSHEYAENDKEKRVPDGDSSGTTESAGQNDESYYDAIFRRSTVGKTVLLLEEAAARVPDSKPNGASKEAAPLSAPSVECSYRSVIVRAPPAVEQQQSSERKEQAELWRAGVRQPPPRSQLASTMCLLTLPVPNTPKPMYTAVSVCNSSCTLHEGGSEKRPATIGSTHQQSSCTREEQAGLRWDGVRQPPPRSQSTPTLNPLTPPVPTAQNPLYTAVSWSAPSHCLLQRPVPIVPQPVYTAVSMSNTRHTLHEGSSEKHAATFGSIHQQSSCTGGEQAELWPAGVRKPLPPSQLALSLPEQLGPLPIPPKPKAVYTVASLCNSSSTSQDGGSEGGAATIDFTHQQGSCTREEQSGLWQAGVRQHPPLASLGPSLHMLPVPVRSASKVVYTAESLCKSSATSHEDASEKHAATIVSPHQQSSCTGEEQAGLWSSGVRQPLPPSQLAHSLPEQLGPLPIPPKAMYRAASLCSSSSSTQYEGGSAESASTIGSTHQQGSSTGEEQAGLWQAGVRQPAPLAPLGPSQHMLPMPVPTASKVTEEQAGLWQAGVRQPAPLAPLGPSQHMLPMPVPTASKVTYTAASLCCSSSTAHEDGSKKRAATIVSRHQHSSWTGEEQAGLWQAGVRQPAPLAPLGPSQHMLPMPVPTASKVTYTAASLCCSSSTAHEDGSKKRATTIVSRHQHSSCTGEEQAGLWQAGVRQPAPLAPLGPSQHMLPMPVPTASKVTYTAASLCCSSSTAHEDGSKKRAATIVSRHQHSSCTGEEQAGLWQAGVRQPAPLAPLGPSWHMLPMPVPTASKVTEEQAGLWQAGVRQPAPLAPLGPSQHMLPMSVPTASKVTYTAASLCCSSSTAHEDGSKKRATTIVSRHQHSSCTGEEQAGLWQAGVRQPAPLAPLGPSRHMLPMTVPTASKVTEEQAGLWPAGVRQSLPPSQVALSLPPLRGPPPIPLKSMYTVESLCNSSRTSYEDGSAEGAATIGSTHEQGSCTG
ncbi:uncharacterized protein LOC126184101 [Schistocerca cancellata]|uniref:uncharacterized protein LOC126184101 n=1 Tax=Schistocerca cancellata TaxID=274614 RepID=UPI002118770F|nr:uncharacterized protein LOC126184101 [Schistocerca cancellata]